MTTSKYDFSKYDLRCPQSHRGHAGSLRDLVRQAFDAPINYPPLQQSIIAGDRIAVALQPDVPHGASVANEVIDYLIDLGLDPSDISLVVPKRMNYPVPDDPDLSPRSKIHVHVHDPDDELAVSYLAANADDAAVKICGRLFDADVIIPIACVDSADHSQLYPEFSSTETIDRMRETRREHPNKSDSETQLTIEHLGLFTAMNVVGAPGNAIQHIAFGTRPDADHVAREMADEIWQVPQIPDAEIVVVTIEASDGISTWQQFARAVINAARISRDDVPLVVLAEIDSRPDQKMHDALQLQFETDDEVLYRRTKKYDALTRDLIQTLRERQVFGWLGLEEETMEELGIGSITGDAQLERLLNRFEHRYLVRDADRVTVGATQPTV